MSCSGRSLPLLMYGMDGALLAPSVNAPFSPSFTTWPSATAAPVPINHLRMHHSITIGPNTINQPHCVFSRHVPEINENRRSRLRDVDASKKQTPIKKKKVHGRGGLSSRGRRRGLFVRPTATTDRHSLFRPHPASLLPPTPQDSLFRPHPASLLSPTPQDSLVPCPVCLPPA